MAGMNAEGHSTAPMAFNDRLHKSQGELLIETLSEREKTVLQYLVFFTFSFLQRTHVQISAPG